MQIIKDSSQLPKEILKRHVFQIFKNNVSASTLMNYDDVFLANNKIKGEIYLMLQKNELQNGDIIQAHINGIIIFGQYIEMYKNLVKINIGQKITLISPNNAVVIKSIEDYLKYSEM